MTTSWAVTYGSWAYRVKQKGLGRGLHYLEGEVVLVLSKDAMASLNNSAG